MFFYIDTTVQMCYFGLPGDGTLLLPCENRFLIVFTLIPKHAHARTHTHLLEDVRFFTEASQRPKYHCCDDLLNSKWYHA